MILLRLINFKHVKYISHKVCRFGVVSEHY